jgi:hypothetical protein
MQARFSIAPGFHLRLTVTYLNSPNIADKSSLAHLSKQDLNIFVSGLGCDNKIFLFLITAASSSTLVLETGPDHAHGA